MRTLRYLSRRFAELATYVLLSAGAVFGLLFAAGQKLEVILFFGMIIGLAAAFSTIGVRLSPFGREDKSSWRDGIGDGRGHIAEAERIDKQWFIWW